MSRKSNEAETSRGKPDRPELGERAQHLLKVLINRYTVDGQPVGSRTLARDTDVGLSPATIRNVMADLEDMGFVQSPHTSSGRIPTVQGYRFFVDSLMTVKPLHSKAVRELGRQLDANLDTKGLVGSVSSLLSGVTGLAGVVTIPRHEQVALRHIDFLPLSQNRVLVIMVVNKQEVQNRIIHTHRVYSRSELEQAANFLNEQFVGRDIHAVRAMLIKEMRDTRADLNRIMATAIEFAEQVFEEESGSEDCVFTGQTNLMSWDDLSDLDKLKQLFDAFSEKQAILHLLDECLHGEGIQIFIGDESGYAPLDTCSMVTAPYTVENQVVGVLGVIGPTRMAYDRIIPIVDTTARLLGAALKSRD